MFGKTVGARLGADKDKVNLEHLESEKKKMPKYWWGINIGFRCQIWDSLSLKNNSDG